MSPLTFTLRAAPPCGVDCAPLTPERLAGMTLREIEHLELSCGRERLKLAELFRVSGADARHLGIAADHHATGVGTGMASGSIRVEGDAGEYAGEGMRGGCITIAGNAGAFAGSGMRGGRLAIAGSAGAFLGAARPGERHGMRGGLITVGRDAGERLGDRMRRGLILVQGDAGRYCAARALAGTVLVRGTVGEGAGFGLKRGTLLLEREPRGMLPTFQDCGTLDWLWITLLEKELLRDADLRVFLPLRSRRRRYCGDLALGGAGEILVASA